MKQAGECKAGNLFVVATPIGNLGDLSPRALETLRDVDLVAAEDTRHSGALLSHFGVRKPMLSLHSHNEAAQSEQLLARLLGGESVALVSDAGTPLISDPGFPLIRAARQRGIRVTPIPGPSAVIAALSIAGLPCERFVFEGFLPAKRSARRQKLAALAGEARTMVFYESPHRIGDMLEDLVAVLGEDRRLFLGRELTKLHEQSFAGEASQALQWLAEDEHHRKGEFVVVVEGGAAVTADRLDEDQLLKTLLDYLSVKDASHAAARILGAPRKSLYNRLLALKRDSARNP